MNQIKDLAIKKVKVSTLVQFVALIGIASAAPLLHQQIITGSIVNATLFISTMLLGVQGGILIGLTPSLIALSTGLLSPVLAPMIPFIMMGNVILVISFNYLKGKNYWMGIISASILKFLFLFSSSSMVMNLILKKELALKVSTMMSWPQLLTALLGGLIAYLFLKSFSKKIPIGISSPRS